MTQAPTIYRCAIQSPVNRLFDYLAPSTEPDLSVNCSEITTSSAIILPGQRVEVPFGPRKVTAIIISVHDKSEFPLHKLKNIHRLIDAEPIIDSTLMQLMQWASEYYHHPLGDVIFGFLPTLLRKGRDASIIEKTKGWQLSHLGQGLGPDSLKRAKKQAQVITLLRDKNTLSRSDLDDHDISTATIRTLINKGLIETASQETMRAQNKDKSVEQNKQGAKKQRREQALTANTEQQHAIDLIQAKHNKYGCYLLHGVTGSGKTEVYMQLIAQQQTLGKQSLVLVPEIGLTPQMRQRFVNRFGDSVVAMHSSLSELERLNAWLQARAGQASVIIGTRSALMTALPSLGLIIVDEEHDSSYKQQEGLRYSARDLAVKRAHANDIPIVLGSATPSFESLHNMQCGRYQYLSLKERAGGAKPPAFTIIDARENKAADGLSLEVIQAMQRHLDAKHQVLVFINRRGYAPTLLCQSCGWIAQCEACESRLTAHTNGHMLICHHCDQRMRWPNHCPSCKQNTLQPLGAGTQRSESSLEQHFPDTKIIRVDRDSTQRKGQLAEKLAQAATGDPCILIGTQMLAKGHHFPELTLVVILDADAALYSADFRGPERMAQTLTQVAGRAGRGDVPGEVLIQSELPDHPMLQSIISKPYIQFAEELLEQRAIQLLPPYCKSAALFGEFQSFETLMQVMQSLTNMTFDPQSTGRLSPPKGISLVGPVPAAMIRRANRFRAQLLIYSETSTAMNRALQQLRHAMDKQKRPSGVRLTLDVDPIDTN